MFGCGPCLEDSSFYFSVNDQSRRKSVLKFEGDVVFCVLMHELFLKTKNEVDSILRAKEQRILCLPYLENEREKRSLGRK